MRYVTSVCRYLAVAALLLSFFATGRAVADEWPQWMGPTRDGVYRESGIVQAIPAEGLPVRWRQPIGGGYAGPAVAEGRVVVTDYLRTAGEAFNDPGQRASIEGSERVRCFDAATGRELWEHAYDCSYSISYPAGPRATPTIDDGRVYTLGAEGDIRCLDLTDGRLLWQKSLKKDYQASVPIWGFASHLLVEGDLVISMVGGEGQTVVAWDKQSGEERWRALSASAPGYCPPSIVEAGGERQLVVWHADALVSLQPSDGAVHWTVPLTPAFEMAITRPQRDGDRLYVSGIRNEAVMLRLDSERPAVEELWRGDIKNAVNCAISTPIFADGIVYGTDCNVGNLVAVDGQSGERLWTTFQATRPGETRRLSHGTAFLTRIGATDRYLIFSETGELILATLTREGYEEQGRFQVLQPTGEAFGREVVWSHPAYAGRTAFVRNDEELVAVSLEDP